MGRGTRCPTWLVCAAAVASLWALASCSTEQERFCQLGQEHTVARSVALEFDAVVLLARGDGVTALWSDRSGLFGRLLDAEGRPVAESVRIGPQCAGGISALAGEQGYDLACSIPARGLSDRAGREAGGQAETGTIVVLTLDAGLGVVASRRLGEVGPLSEGVSLQRGSDGLWLAWHDGAPDAHRIWFAGLAPAAEPPRVVSTSGRMAAAPSLGIRDGRPQVAWAERWLERGDLDSRVAYWDGGGNPVTMLPVAHLQAMPQLIALGSEQLLAYRDRRGAGDRTGLYLGRVAGRGELIGELARVGRADGSGRPSLSPCMDGLVTATPRTYGGDYFVGINWLDARLERVRGEQQFYEDTHAFSRASAACTGSHAVILIAEYAELHDTDGAAIRAVPYFCH